MLNNFISNYVDTLKEASNIYISSVDKITKGTKFNLYDELYKLNFRDINDVLNLLITNPESLTEFLSKFVGKSNELNKKNECEDKRFSSPEWNSGDYYNQLKDSYLLFSRSIENALDSFDYVDVKAKSRLKFFSRQFINAISPSNFALTNPEITALTINENGNNLLLGLRNMLEDLKGSGDFLNISHVNKDAFKIGLNLATTPGSVIFKNEICEIIQYKAVTEKVLETPLLIIPPLINKYYILDLNEKKSMVRWLLEQGHTVFIISWKNPDISLKSIGFERYVLDGVVQAINVIESVTGCKQVNAAGYCIGGTLLATTVAYYSAKKLKNKIKSATYFATLLDFSTPGDIGAYIDPLIFSAIDNENNKIGVMDGKLLNTTFNMLRENDLYWNYYTNNYLKGMKPNDYDLLFWSGDSVNVTASCWRDIVKNFYLENKLIIKKGIHIDGVDLDLSSVNTSSYFVSTKEDHIALWQSTYNGAKIFKGKTTFVLGEAGHVAGIINPPSKGKYGYWTNDLIINDPDLWLSSASKKEGSWWEHWDSWLKTFESKEQRAFYSIGNELYPALAKAPGEYVQSTLYPPYHV